MRIGRAIAWGALGAFVLWVVGFAWVRLRGATAEQVAASRLLAVPVPPLHGRNLDDAAWFLDFEVPEAERGKLLVELRRYNDRRSALSEEGKSTEAMALVDPREAFPQRPAFDANAPLCEVRQPGCLARARADPAAVAAILETHRSGLDAALALADHDGYRFVGRPSLHSALPMFSGQRRLVPTHFASQFAQGDRSGALAGACKDLAGWRRIGANSDQWIPALIATAYAGQDVALIAEFVADLPANEALPPVCLTALAPTTAAELDLCPTARGEFAILKSTKLVPAEVNPAGVDRLLARLADPDRIATRIAPAYARLCGEEARRLASADSSFARVQGDSATCSRLERIFGPTDCVLADLVDNGNALGGYLDRRTDLAAKLALLRTALWLRETDVDPRPRAQRLAERPASLGLRREATLADEGRTLVMPLLETTYAEEVRFALPLLPTSDTGKSTGP